MAWIYLSVAGLCEIAWAAGLKYSEGFTRLWPSVWTTVAMIATYVFLGLAVRTIPIGTAYAIWAGIGTAGSAVYGILVFGEAATAGRVACLALITLGVVGLKFVGE